MGVSIVYGLHTLQGLYPPEIASLLSIAILLFLKNLHPAL